PHAAQILLRDCAAGPGDPPLLWTAATMTNARPVEVLRSARWETPESDATLCAMLEEGWWAASLLVPLRSLPAHAPPNWRERGNPHRDQAKAQQSCPTPSHDALYGLLRLAR